MHIRASVVVLRENAVCRNTMMTRGHHSPQTLPSSPHSSWTRLDSQGNGAATKQDICFITTFCCRFSAEAAIVNFYHLDSTLSGHTDHSERDLSLPLLSIR